MNFMQLAGIGPLALLAVICLVPATIFTAIALGRIWRIQGNLALLLGVGTAICGSSAIAAISPVLKATHEESAVSISAINILSAIGVLVFSWLSYIVPLDDVAYGIWSGLSMQAVPTAIAAAGARSELALQYGTIVKMARVALLVPTSIIISILASRARIRGEASSRVSLPLFIVLFLIAGIVSTLGLIPADGISLLGRISSVMLVISMTAIGLAVDFSALRRSAGPALGKGLVLFGLLSVVAYFWSLLLISGK
jgi:uncharacterized integral membrane protein (TIGR00698 family)